MANETTPVQALDARYYTDADIYQRECQTTLAQTWQFAGHRSSLAKAGDYFTVEIAGESLICVRTENDTLKAFYNVCQHRAHPLVTGSGNTQRLVCPYHSWTYELTGQLRNGPNLAAVKGLDRSTICLTEVKIEDFCGFLFINLNPNARPMDEWFPRVREELTSFVPFIEQLKPAEWVEVAEHCNWKVSVENYSECYHCQKNHPTFSEGIIKPGTYDIQPQGYCLRHTTECQDLENLTYTINPSANEHASDYSSWYLWPLFSFQVYPGNILNTYHWRVVDHQQVIVWRGWYSRDPSELATIRALAKQDRETTVEEDVRLVNAVQRGLNSRGYIPGPLVIDPAGGVKSEHSIQVLQQWMRSGIGE